MAIETETHLGDGLYASYDGFQIRLRAPRGRGEDHEVFMDAHVLREFKDWLTTKGIIK